jgi:hypothetical protein
MRPPSVPLPAPVRRTLLLWVVCPLALTLQLSGAAVLAAALPAALPRTAVLTLLPGSPVPMVLRGSAAPMVLRGSAVPMVLRGSVVPVAVPRADVTPRGRFRWPVDGSPRPVRPFDPPPQPWLAGHRGVDLADPVGAVIHSAGPGTVLFAGPVAGRPVVTVGHADGPRTTYEPVAPGVRAGQPVTAGTPLGELLPGHPSCPAAACLHWGLRRGTAYLDPLALLGLGPVRLYPVDAPPP